MKFDILPKDVKLPKTGQRVKFGIDPTSDQLHLGHLVPLMLVKRLKDEGNHVTIVLGTFTAQMGDPSGKDKTRPILDQFVTKSNAESILGQVTRVIGEGFDVARNHEWFERITLPEMMKTLAMFNVGHLMARDSFQKRQDAGNPIGMHELIVPLLQGLDSVELRTQIEVGGSDQLFNFMMSRDLQAKMGQEPEACFLTPIINGTDGKKMSKTSGNCIFINDRPEDVFGKTMSISDETMHEWSPIFLSEWSQPERPMQLKMRLAQTLTSIIWGPEKALQARQHFEDTIQKKQAPEDMPSIGLRPIVDFVVEMRGSSRNQARQLLAQDGVRVNGDKVDEEYLLIPGDVVQAGKRCFARVQEPQEE